jgi:hypothetical protein
MIVKQTKKFVLAGLSLAAMTTVALADDTTSGYSGLDTMDAAKAIQKFDINPGYLYEANADFDHGGDVSVMRFDLPARYTLKLKQGELGLGALYEYSYYSFGNASLNDQKFNTLAFNAYWKSMFNDNWGYFVFGGGGYSASTKTDFGSGGTGMGGAGVRYVVSPTLSFGLGGGIASQIEDDPTFLPVILMNWQIDDRWALRVFNGATISYDLSGEKRFVLDAGANYQRRQYALDHGGAAIDKQVNVEFGATYRFSEQFGIRGFVGVAAARNFEIRQHGDKLGDEDVDSTPYFGVRALLTF